MGVVAKGAGQSGVVTPLLTAYARARAASWQQASPPALLLKDTRKISDNHPNKPTNPSTNSTPRIKTIRNTYTQ
jgi:hypothetical protein